MRVALADMNVSGAEAVASTYPNAMAVELDAADWDSQLAAFKTVQKEFGRIDYVYPIAGIGERKWIPNDPKAIEFAKPDLSVLDVDLNGLLYTTALAVQQMRRQDLDERGLRGKSEHRQMLLEARLKLTLVPGSRGRGICLWILLRSE